jgi:hypothetical protein
MSYRRNPKTCLLICAAMLLAAGAAGATHLSLALDVEGEGLGMAHAGAGLVAGAGSLSLNIPGPVEAALLYWTGRDRPCPESAPGVCTIPLTPYKDQVLSFDGHLVTGTIIGTEGQPASADGPIHNIGYLADVTAIVLARGTGAQAFPVADGDAGDLFRLDGAGLLVIYRDLGDSGRYRLIVFDGLDFAFGDDPTPGETRVTQPVMLVHGAEPAARAAELRMCVGDAESHRPDRVDISNNPSVMNGFDGSSGSQWDSDLLPISIPAGAGSTTVQLFSEPAGQNPDSLLWVMAALRVPLARLVTGEQGCTPGYWKNHTDSWAAAGLLPGQTAGSVFAVPFPQLANRTLLQTLQGGGGPGALGGARILLRAAVAALLDAAHPGVDYPWTPAEVVAEVNAALATGDRSAMLALAGELDAQNNLGCPLN